MRIRRRSDRRASLTRRLGAVLLLGLLAALAPRAPSAAGQRGLRRRRLPRPGSRTRRRTPWSTRGSSTTASARRSSPGGSTRRTRSRSTTTGRAQHWGNASNWKNAATVAEHPGRQQPDPRRRRLVGGRLGRLLARPRRLGADRRRRRDHDRGVQLPPRRLLRHPHDLQLELDVAERLHPHQGHPDPQHRRRRRSAVRRRSARS